MSREKMNDMFCLQRQKVTVGVENLHKIFFFHKFLCLLKYYSRDSINENEMDAELRTNVRL